MTERLSARLQAIVDALPLERGMRVLEIGCGPGAAARAVARRVGDGFVLAIDRSARAVALARTACRFEIEAGAVDVRQIAAEDFRLQEGDAPFDLAFAVRVGALDGRHPAAGRAARQRIAAALAPHGRLFIDGGDPLREIDLSKDDALRIRA
ncbi:MAG: methyltransferase domain-containing protein [Rhizobiaceae bacterium]|nr:methyltransferase domain-containing protein [Rhizobiaceae bacterium]MCV0406383.1 methyltransferase domain-containing protein [Rhizobiaceae bacterium]